MCNTHDPSQPPAIGSRGSNARSKSSSILLASGHDVNGGLEAEKHE